MDHAIFSKPLGGPSESNSSTSTAQRMKASLPPQMPQTPQRPLPGAFLQTPAPAGNRPGGMIQRPSFNNGTSTTSPRANGLQQGQRPGQPQQQLQTMVPVSSYANMAQMQGQPLSAVQRAARTVNDYQAKDGRFPEIDGYVKQGISSDYGVITNEAMAPFQRTKMYDIPDVILEQYNRAQVSTMMGLFADLNHAWVTIDNALYLWDYTQPNPTPIGFEEQPNTITAVSLIVPRAGVFQPIITHVLVVATPQEMILLGVSAASPGNGAKILTLYQTKMSLSVRGIDVRVIEGSTTTGRIFFAGSGDNELYEFTYQQEERWFANRCAKVNWSTPGYNSLVPTWSKKISETVAQIVVDDSRGLVYTLSSQSAIRTFHMDSPTTLKKILERSRGDSLSDIGHKLGTTSPLLGNTMQIVSISGISSTESAKLHLMATTSTGCRLFMSATRGYGYNPDSRNPPTSMQIQHIKFPPPVPRLANQQSRLQNEGQEIDTRSQSLQFSRTASRFPPGFFFCFVQRGNNSASDTLFLSAPDPGRIAFRSHESQAPKYYEQTHWQALGGRAEAVGLITPPYAAASRPAGFGNELAVQFDHAPSEIAVLTNTGIQTFKRRRLVDMFAGSIKNGGGEEGLEGEIRKLVRLYGRPETLSAALAVACGQGATDPLTQEIARKTFIEYGGKASLLDNAITDGSIQAVDLIKPSARFEGLAMYVSRLVRSVWKAPVVKQNELPGGVVAITSAVSATKLRSVQDDLSSLDKFLEKVSGEIQGLNGAEGLSRAASKNEELEIQGEHQALNALRVLIKSIIEGISFMIMLFEERVDELWAELDDSIRQRLRDLTYEVLFASPDGTELAKALVKAIVSRSIANGANVDTVAEALRRRCRNFCSAEDVDVFRAQDNLKRAAEVGPASDVGRRLLNSSLQLFEGVAGSLTPQTLQDALQQYVEVEYFAGAIQLALKVAQQIDPANRALNWFKEGKPESDPRADLYRRRKRCYELVQTILESVDQIARQQPLEIDGRPTTIAKKRREAHDVVNGSDDELFQDDLYQWYLSMGLIDRLHEIQTPYLVSFLERTSSQLEYRDLLWQYHAKWQQYHLAATVQLALAKSDLDLSLKQRIEYLSRAKANSLTSSNGIARQTRQVLIKEVSDLLEIANIQDDILQRLRIDQRLEGDRREDVIKALGGNIIDISDLYNTYADQAGFYDSCLLIYQAADHRNPGDIEATWQNLITKEHQNVLENANDQYGKYSQPYEAVMEKIRSMAAALSLSESLFPISTLLLLVEVYAFEEQRGIGPPHWPVELFIEIGVPYQTILSVLDQAFYNDIPPFQGRNREIIASEMFEVIKKWYSHCRGSNLPLFGGGEVAKWVLEMVGVLRVNNTLRGEEAEEAGILARKIEREVRDFGW